MIRLLLPLAILCCACAPSVYAQRQAAARAAYAAAFDAVSDGYMRETAAAVREGRTTAEREGLLDGVRVRWTSAWWGLRAVDEARERVGADLVPPVCAMLPALARVGIVVDVGALCELPTCWDAQLWARANE